MKIADKDFSKEDFWRLIETAKSECGQDLDAEYQWLTERLTELSPEAALSFHGYVHGYEELAYQYGLWDAASLMCRGCSDDGFLDFRAWLIAQGKEVYLAALKDPDSLADVPLYGDGNFETLSYVGNQVYEAQTGRSAYDNCDPAMQEKITAELRGEVEYRPGIQYPRDKIALEHYLPRLYQRAEGDIPLNSWNLDREDIQQFYQEGQQFDRQQAAEKTILKLYSPLTAELEVKPAYDPYYGIGYAAPSWAKLTGAGMVYYQEAILKGIQDETFPEEAERGLMTYFSGSPEVDRKVHSLRVTVENHNGTLYGVAVCELKEPLRPNELEELKSAAIGQYADGWGEGFEQRPRSTGDGDLYVHFWQPENFYIRTAQEMEQIQQRGQKNRGGDAR